MTAAVHRLAILPGEFGSPRNGLTTRFIDMIDTPLFGLLSELVRKSGLGKLGTPKGSYVLKSAKSGDTAFTLWQEKIGTNIKAAAFRCERTDPALLSVVMEGKKDVAAEHDHLREDNNVEILAAFLDLQQIADALLDHVFAERVKPNPPDV